MKLFIFAVLFVGLALAAPDFNESEKDFEKEMNEMTNDESKEEGELKKAEGEINDNNNDPKATEKEKLYPDSDLPKEEFEKEKEGAKMPEGDVARLSAFSGDREYGIIMPPAHIRDDPVNKANMDAIYAEIAADRQAAPASYDANAAGLVTTAKNQRSCGSCAAFGATGLHETCMIKAGAKKSGLDLSEQWLVDCGYNGGSMNGCNGAYPHSYTDFFNKKGGQAPHEGKYPYLNRFPKKTCPSTSTAPIWNSGAKVSSASWDFRCNADKLKALVFKHGAVAATIYASDSGFSNYASGVLSSCSSKKINHAVLVVGYGTENGMDYWLVKNSWGSNWGANGFIKVKRGSNECGIEGICTVASCASTGGSDTAPPAPKPKPIPAALYCDISSMYWPGINGRYTLHTYAAGKIIVADVKCKNSKCTPSNPGPSNACMYICGKLKC